MNAAFAAHTALFDCAVIDLLCGLLVTQEVASSLNIPGTILSKTRTNENGAKKFSIEERNGCLSTSEVSGGDRRQKQ